MGERTIIMSRTDISIGLLGFGTVGSGVFKLLNENKDTIAAKYGFNCSVKKILVRNPNKKRPVRIPKRLLARNIHDIISDRNIDVVIEVIGGRDPAKKYITEALSSGKHIITANKVLMGNAGVSLIKNARRHERFLGFSAAITGCHQFCSTIENSVMITALEGILNSTSNYILTEMAQGSDFQEALIKAQQEGYAEADPSEDIDGDDTFYKLIILVVLAFGRFLDRRNVKVKGIRDITKEDIEFSRRLGYVVKLIGRAEKYDDGKIEAWVEPCLVAAGEVMASINGINNGIQVHDAIRGLQAMSAYGAGAQATSMAIFKDLMEMARNSKIIWPSDVLTGRNVKYVYPNQRYGRYYVRFNADNTPGVLAGITKVLAQHNINISDISQHAQNDQKHVPVVAICGRTQELNLMKALDKIASQAGIIGKARLIRVLDPLINYASLAA